LWSGPWAKGPSDLRRLQSPYAYSASPLLIRVHPTCTE
jgi:hypothetical protein